LLIITITGLLSYRLGHDYVVTNPYGDLVRLFGYGIYARDSYFKAPIFIGSDLAMLIIVVPLLLWATFGDLKKSTLRRRVTLIALVGVVVYYATSIAFGITYNALMLAYIALFSTSLFTLFVLIFRTDLSQLTVRRVKGLDPFLVVTGVALFGIWLMDIIPTWLNGSSLPLIETYTTEITYVLDMGLISPLIFVGLYLRKKHNALGELITIAMLTLCVIVGLMLPVQTGVQLMAGIEIPVPVLVIKVGIFVVLALIAAVYDGLLLRQR